MVSYGNQLRSFIYIIQWAGYNAKHCDGILMAQIFQYGFLQQVL